MSQKEARRLYVIEQTIAGKLTVRQAAELLSLSHRQVKRLKKGVAMMGAASLPNPPVGKDPSRP